MKKATLKPTRRQREDETAHRRLTAVLRSKVPSIRKTAIITLRSWEWVTEHGSTALRAKSGVA